MCTPVIAAVALTAAGTAAQAAGASRARRAMQGAREAERIRQKGYREQAETRVGESLAKSSRESADRKLSEAEAERASLAEKAVADVRAPIEAVGTNLAGDSSAASVVSDETKAQAAKNLGFALQQGLSKSKIGAMDELNFANAINNIRASQDLSMIGNFMRGSADVLPVELEAASKKGDKLNALGSVLKTAGLITGIGAGSGWFDAAKTAPTTAGAVMGPTINTAGTGDLLWGNVNSNQNAFGDLLWGGLQ